MYGGNLLASFCVQRTVLVKQPGVATATDQLLNRWVHGKSAHTQQLYCHSAISFLEFVGKPLLLQHPLALARVPLTQVRNRVHLYTLLLGKFLSFSSSK